MSESLGWSRTLFTGAATLQSLGNVMISPIVGPLIDRRDPRWIMLTAAVIAAISYNLMGRITEPWQFYILYTTATALGLNELGILVTNVLVSKWFIRMRGRALAVISIGNNFGAIFIIPFTGLASSEQRMEGGLGHAGDAYCAHTDSSGGQSLCAARRRTLDYGRTATRRRKMIPHKAPTRRQSSPDHHGERSRAGA